MANHFDAYTTPAPGGGYHGMVRFSHKSQAWPILHHGEPIVFTMKSAALIAAQEHLIKHINGTMTRLGDRAEMAKTNAEKHFTRQRGSSKTTAIEIKRRGT